VYAYGAVRRIHAHGPDASALCVTPAASVVRSGACNARSRSASASDSRPPYTQVSTDAMLRSARPIASVRNTECSPTTAPTDGCMTCSANAAPVVSENVISPVSSHNRVPGSIGLLVKGVTRSG